MATSEARRRHLCNGPDQLLGTERADTLMAYLPADEITELATRTTSDMYFITQSAGLIAIVGTPIAALLLRGPTGHR